MCVHALLWTHTRSQWHVQVVRKVQSILAQKQGSEQQGPTVHVSVWRSLLCSSRGRAQLVLLIPWQCSRHDTSLLCSAACYVPA